MHGFGVYTELEETGPDARIYLPVKTKITIKYNTQV